MCTCLHASVYLYVAQFMQEETCPSAEGSKSPVLHQPCAALALDHIEFGSPVKTGAS